MNGRKIILGVIVMITLGTMIGATGILQQSAYAKTTGKGSPEQFFTMTMEGAFITNAPPAITGDNVYVAWWSNKTGNEEVIFRASADAGKTFGDKINLSNTTDADSWRVEIDSDADNVAVTWWETNETSDVPVIRVSDDNGKTFGPLLKLATNGTLGG
jgi:hypothetical protein